MPYSSRSVDAPTIIRNQVGAEISSVENWFLLAPPKGGTAHWRDFRSAKELAKNWFREGNVCAPLELRRLLAAQFGDELQLVEAIPECTVRLDRFRGEQRNCDLIVYGRTPELSLVVSIEAKADEPFGSEIVGAYYDAKVGTRSNVPARIRGLADSLFGRFDAEVRSLRYQLLHSAVAALIEAKNRNANIAVLLVHEFLSSTLDPRKIAQNMADWTKFVRTFELLRNRAVEENQLLGPLQVPIGNDELQSIPLYLGHLTTTCFAHENALSAIP